MRRLPNTYPGNIAKYPNGRGTFLIGSADEGSKVLFYNETPVNLDLDFYNGNTDVLHAWEANFWTLDGEVGDITWAIDVDSLNVVNPPINAVFATVLNPNETLRDKAYPMPLIRQIGGQQAIVSSASQVINDGNALQQVVEATLQGHGSSDVIINNDGSFTLKGAGLIAAASVLTHILGTLTVDQAAIFSALVTVAAAGIVGPGGATLLSIDSGGTGAIQFKVNGANSFQASSSGPNLNAGTKYTFLQGTMSRQNGNGSTACTSATVISHGLGATPALVVATPNIAGSATVGITAVGATTFTSTVGAGSLLSWWCLAG